MKKIFIFVTMAALLSTLIGCSTSKEELTAPSNEPTSEQVISFDLDDYKAAVSECRQNIADNSLYLSNVGNYEFNFVKALGSISDDTTGRAFEWLAEKSDATKESVDAVDVIIREQYKAIIATEIEGKEAEEIEEAVRALYDAYSSLYSLVVDPTGTVSDFGKNLQNCISSITDSDDALMLWLN